jgi:hypothetical protein
MILLFPDLDTLRLTLTGNVVPTDVTLAPAAVSFGEQGWIYVEPTVSLSRAVTKSLDRLGVKGSKRHATDTPQEVSSWVQILPLGRESGTPHLSSQGAVLFELASADDLPTLVGEMLRLGNDRQAFRWFADPSEGDARRVLLRVIGPPYYTLLRALDRSAAGTTGGVRAYLEKAPRVWVEIGHTHPLAAQIRVAERQLLLIRAPREWLFLDEAPFQDVYDILQFKLPAGPVGWTETKAPKKMTVPLRLTAGNAADVPELWVLRENAVEQLDTLVRDADDRLTQRLMFAVATDPKGSRTVVLRTRPSKLAPPVLPLESALGFKPFWKLPNLFLPVGKRLHPTLRRDAVRKLLADDADQVVWLYPDEKGGFTPESVADSAFRSLEDWVDYIINAEQQPLAAWIEATRFDFDHFICKDGGGPKTRPDKGDKEPRGKDEEDLKAPKGATQATKPTGKGKPSARPGGPSDFLPAPAEPKPESEWKRLREELERKFKAIEGPLDAPERQALWPELAKANTGLGDATEASVCWLNALWDADPPPAEWLAGWVRSEMKDATGTIRADEFDKRLGSPTSSVQEARAVVACFLWLANQHPVPAWLGLRLPAVQKYVEAHAGSLPVRAVWLAGYRLAQLGGGDVLGLARVRDRLLQRLLERGLEAERDLPSFLRYAGLREPERMRTVREKALDLHNAVKKWSESIPVNQPYIDLLFAFALGRLGESTPARQLLDSAAKEMNKPAPSGSGGTQQDQAMTAKVVREFLFKAFKYRVEQVMAGKPHAGQMSAELLADLDDIAKKGGSGPVNNPHKLAEYVIARMREQSRIIEPQEKPDPYAAWTKHGDALKKELAELPTIRDPGKLADRVRRLYKDGVPGKPMKDVQLLVLHEAVPLSYRVGESFTVEQLNLVPAALAAGPAGSAPGNEPPDLPKKQGELLEGALRMAGHFDRGDLVQKLVGQFIDLVHSKPDAIRFKLVNAVGGQALRSLRKFGLKDTIDHFLRRLQSEVLKGGNLTDLRRKYAAKPEEWGTVLQTLLNLAAGWLTFGLNEQAAQILDEARTELLGPTGLKLQPKDYTELAQGYVAALGQGPSESGLPRITELFRKMGQEKITNTWTTAPYYSRLHLNLVETVILAVVSDEFALGPAGRRWLDDDEYLVRKRIHADMKRNLDKSGL